MQLQEQNYVRSFSFITPELKHLIKNTQDSGVSDKYGIKLMNIKGDSIKPDIYGIDEHLLDSISSELYFPTSENSNYNYEKLSTGQKNAVKTIFEITNKNVSEWTRGDFDPKHIMAYTTGIDKEIDIETFNIIIPESLKWLLTFDAGNDKLDIANV